MAYARSRIWRVLLLILLAMVLVLLLSRLRKSEGESDFLVYWSAARLLATGGNPFDQTMLQTLQQVTRPEHTAHPGQGWAAWNPPWLLVVLLPLGLLPFNWAARVWMLCSITGFLLAAAWTWRWCNMQADRHGLLIALVATLAFGQTLSCLHEGQISGLVLIGLVLGVWCLQTRHDVLAGSALLLAMIKPQIGYLVLWLVMWWVLCRRRWQVALGMTAAALASMALLWVLFPGWLPAYWTLLRSHPSVFFSISAATLGGLAYALWGTHVLRFAGVLLLPLTGVLLPLVDRLGWLTTMNIALLASVPLAPYGFNYDQVVLLPSMVQMMAWMRRGELPKRWAWTIAIGLLLMNAVLLRMLMLPSIYNHWLAWPPLVLGGLYALAWRQRRTAGGGQALPRKEGLQ